MNTVVDANCRGRRTWFVFSSVIILLLFVVVVVVVRAAHALKPHRTIIIRYSHRPSQNGVFEATPSRGEMRFWNLKYNIPNILPGTLYNNIYVPHDLSNIPMVQYIAAGTKNNIYTRKLILSRCSGLVSACVNSFFEYYTYFLFPTRDSSRPNKRFTRCIYRYGAGIYI